MLFLFTTVVSTLLLATIVLAQGSCPSKNFKTCPRKPEKPSGTISKINGLSGESDEEPFSAALRMLGGKEYKQLRKDITDITSLFDDTWVAKNKSIEEQEETACNKRNNNWTPEVEKALNDRNLGKLDKACTTGIPHSTGKAERLRNTYRRIASTFAKSSREQNWKSPLSEWQYIDSDTDQECSIERATGIRIGNKWHLLASATNSIVSKYMPLDQRYVLEEWISKDLCCPLTLWFPSRNETNTKKAEPRAFSTIVEKSSGKVHISAFYNMPFDRNPSLSRALMANTLAIDQAEDALRLSNVAILALPMAMSFIPVSLIADVSDFAAFAFVLITDVFSVIPFLIKGIELLYTGSDEQVSADTWITGEEALLVAESWVAGCTPKDKYRVWGICFIVIGISVILVGFALEIFTRRFMRRRRLQGEDPRPLGDALLNAHLPAAPRDYDDPFTAPNYSADAPPAPPPTAPPPFSAFYRRFVRRRAAPPTRQQQITTDIIGTGHGVSAGLSSGANSGAAVATAAARGMSPNQVRRLTDDFTW